jgi:glucose/arabinose dehydrogenase
VAQISILPMKFFRTLGSIGVGCFVLALVAPPGDAQAQLALELIADDFDRPCSLAAPHESLQRLMVVEQAGIVKVVMNGQVLPTPFLDLTFQVVVSGEQGLLDICFHPGFETNGRCFVAYNDYLENLVLEEYFANPGGNVNPLSARRLLTIPKPFKQHNGGKLHFGLDTYLYFSTGDGGGAFDPQGNAQNLNSLLGKVLRIDVDTPALPETGLPYVIPATNPFVGQPGVKEEIFAYGLRNPWRMYQDPVSGNLWIGDVGQQLREELNLMRAGQSGQNFGWKCKEGALDTGLCSNLPVPLSPPVYQYDHNEGCAIVAGPIYRGTLLPSFNGYGFFADHCTGRIWTYLWTDAGLQQVVERTAEMGGYMGRISSFGLDSARELYVLHYLPGDLMRVIPNPGSADCDSNGIDDVDELTAGTAFDVDQNGVIDNCQKLLTVSSLVLGQPVDLQYIGAQPGEIVAFLFSARGIGEGPCFLGGSLCLDLMAMVGGSFFGLEFLNISLADASGSAQFQFTMPSMVSFPAFAFQAVTFDGVNASKSNPVQKVTQP